MKKFVGHVSKILLTAALLFTGQSSLAEAKSNDKPTNCSKSFDIRTLKHTETTDKNGNRIIKIQEPEKFINEMGYKKPHPDAVPLEVTIVEPAESQTFEKNNTLAGSRDPYVQVTRVYDTCGSEKIASTSKRGNGTPLELIVQQLESASYNSSVNIDTSIISAGVGYNVTQQYSVSSKEIYNTANDGKMYIIDAYAKNKSQDFDVYEWSSIFYTHRKTGTGSAHKPIGACFAAWYY
ncbi:hypothetical protein [Brevibacillus sp. NRS-1366]|uniref:hypothetical protein n=1 Tax=Brevibacillus sp. NRS-1366 TaxID=3233899 RepID=UPI003D21D0F2